MSLNYDPSQVGVPYVRVQRLTIDYPDAGGVPSATIEQSLAVKLADGLVRVIENMGSFKATLDFTQGDAPIPLVNPETAQPLGADTSLNQAFLAVLAVVRKEQHEHNAE